MTDEGTIVRPAVVGYGIGRRAVECGPLLLVWSPPPDCRAHDQLPATPQLGSNIRIKSAAREALLLKTLSCSGVELG